MNNRRCLTGGLHRAGRLRPMARPSAPRSNPLAMRMQTKYAPAQRAAAYLRRVAALTGAKQMELIVTGSEPGIGTF